MIKETNKTGVPTLSDLMTIRTKPCGLCKSTTVHKVYCSAGFGPVQNTKSPKNYLEHKHMVESGKWVEDKITKVNHIIDDHFGVFILIVAQSSFLLGLFVRYILY